MLSRDVQHACELNECNPVSYRNTDMTLVIKCDFGVCECMIIKNTTQGNVKRV